MKSMMKRSLLLLCASLLALSMLGCAGGTLSGRRAASLQSTAAPAPSATNAPTEAPSATPVAEAAATPAPTVFHSALHFSDLTYESPDTDAILDLLDVLEADIEAGNETLNVLFDRYDEVEALYDEATSSDSFAYLLYAFDVSDEASSDEYTRLDAALTEVYTRLTDVGVQLCKSSPDAEAAARARYGDDYVDVLYQDNALYSDAVTDLINADSALQTEYDALSVSFSVSFQGRDWTVDDIFADEALEYDQLLSLYDLYCTQFNKAAGEIFLEMVGLRDEIARETGYGNYAAYRYACYERDYSVTDAKAFHAAVKEYIVPVFLDAQTSSSLSTRTLYGAAYDEDTFFATLTRVAGEFDGRMSEALSYMLEHELYSTSESADKMEGSFTTNLSEYGMPYIFTQWDDGFRCVGTLLHEFGHFMSYYYDTGNYSLDMAEIDSQGLELLMTPYYEDFYGTRYASAAQTYLLNNVLDSIIAGSMEDEFQQIVYENPDMTLDEINAVYAKLVKEYGMDEAYGYTGTEWAQIPHTFQSPMYYISYSVSVIPALELWEKAQTDRQGAVDTYFSIMERPIYAQLRTVMTENGLSDPIAPSTVKRVAELIAENLG